MPSWLKKFLGLVFLCLVAIFLTNARSFALDKKVSYALSHYIMAVMYDGLGDLDNAIQEYKKTLRLERDVAATHLNLGTTYLKKNDYNKAIDEFNLAAKLDPVALEPHVRLALLYTLQDKLDLATQEYELALKNASRIQPENIEIYKSLGALYLQQKKFQEAEKIYKLVLDLSKDDIEAHFYLASIYNELKNYALAEKELKRCLELKPDYHEALNFLGFMYVEENKNLVEAGHMIQKALEMDPYNGAYIDSLGWFYFKRGRFKEALSELERASSLLEDPVIYDHLGDAYLKMNDAENAKLNWEKSLKLDPKQDKVKKKLEELMTNVKIQSTK
jgi:Tfp pilus assembly protein PilF